MIHSVLATILLLVATCAFANDELASPKVDLRPQFEKLKLDVRQQGKRGACQVFAMVGVME
jgi:hypothetical protein